MRFLKRFVLVSLAMALMLSPLCAQCVDPAKHFRSGVLRHWIFQLTPGAAALAAVQRIENEINTARAGANLPLLVFDPEEPVQVAVWEENNPRGPDGANLPDRMPNQEISLVTFAELPGAFDGEVAVFLTDPFRSNASLTAKGVPGVGATFSRDISDELEGTSSEVKTKWSASTNTDRISFRAQYTSDAVVARGRFPATASYLQCGMAHLLDVLYRSRPTETFEWFDRYQVAVITDFTRRDVDVKLEVSHHDPDVNAIFNDPANRPLALAEYHRVNRLQRP